MKGNPQQMVSEFLFFLLVGVARAGDEDQFVLPRRGHMVVEVSQEAGRVAFGEIVIRPDDQCAGVGDLLRLGKVPVRVGVGVVQRVGEQPLIAKTKGEILMKVLIR